LRAVLGLIDVWLLRQLRTRFHGPLPERLVLAYSKTGENALLWYALAAAGWLSSGKGDRPVFARAARTVFAGQVINYVIKVMIRRARPLLEDLPALMPTVSGLSTPSAHSTTAFAAAGTMCEVWPPAPLYAAATAMALSRPYLGVHYPSDVVAGAALGTALARTAA